MGTYVYTVSTRTVPGIEIDGHPVYFSNFAGKPHWREEENGSINQKTSFAASVHARNGTKPKFFTTTEFKNKDKFMEMVVYDALYDHGLTSYDDGRIGTDPKTVGYIVREGKKFRFFEEEDYIPTWAR
jgi:hypothetical protein